MSLPPPHSDVEGQRRVAVRMKYGRYNQHYYVSTNEQTYSGPQNRERGNSLVIDLRGGARTNE